MSVQGYSLLRAARTLPTRQVFTVVFGTGVYTTPAHGLLVGDQVQFTNSGGALPTGLVAGTTYYIRTVPLTTTFTISATLGGAQLNVSDNGTGTNTVIPVAQVALPIAGAQHVSFHLAASDATIPASATVELRKSSGTWIAAGSATGVTLAGSIAALNAGGIPFIVHPSAGQMFSIPSWDEARITVLGHATINVPNFSIQGQVVGRQTVSDNASPAI
jgi:hypothetical protein